MHAVPADRIHQDITRQTQVTQEVVMVPALTIFRLAPGNRQVADDPLDGKIVEDRAVNHEPVLEPPLGTAAALAIADDQVAPSREPAPGRRGRIARAIQSRT